jgi:hypothetical protein
MPVMPAMCATCPFRDTGWTEVRALLQQRALSTATPICHSTGHALTKRLGPSHLCRGARDFQIQIFYRLGVIDAPTEEAWIRKQRERGLAVNPPPQLKRKKQLP